MNKSSDYKLGAKIEHPACWICQAKLILLWSKRMKQFGLKAKAHNAP